MRGDILVLCLARPPGAAGKAENHRWGAAGCCARLLADALPTRTRAGRARAQARVGLSVLVLLGFLLDNELGHPQSKLLKLSMHRHRSNRSLTPTPPETGARARAW